MNGGRYFILLNTELLRILMLMFSHLPSILAFQWARTPSQTQGCLYDQPLQNKNFQTWLLLAVLIAYSSENKSNQKIMVKQLIIP